MSKLVKLSDMQFAALERRDFDFRGRVRDVSDDAVMAPSTPEEMRQEAEKLLTQASEREEAQAEQARANAVRRVAEALASEAKAKLMARILRDVALAHATALFLEAADKVLVGKDSTAPPRTELADFIVELQPLAASYGCSIVLVGDQTKATVNYTASSLKG